MTCFLHAFFPATNSYVERQMSLPLALPDLFFYLLHVGEEVSPRQREPPTPPPVDLCFKVHGAHHNPPQGMPGNIPCKCPTFNKSLIGKNHILDVKGHEGKISSPQIKSDQQKH